MFPGKVILITFLMWILNILIQNHILLRVTKCIENCYQTYEETYPKGYTNATNYHESMFFLLRFEWTSLIHKLLYLYNFTEILHQGKHPVEVGNKYNKKYNINP